MPTVQTCRSWALAGGDGAIGESHKTMGSEVSSKKPDCNGLPSKRAAFEKSLSLG